MAARLELTEMTALLEAAMAGRPGGEPVPSGRGGTRRVTLRGGKVVFLRHYLRGGMARFFVRDRYLLRPPRPVRELVAMERARAAGCRVPIVHAVAVEEAGLFYRGWIVTAAVEGATSFIDVLAARDEPARAALLTAAGSAIRDLHEAGVFHPDLTGHNLLLDARGEVAVIDFDRAAILPTGRHRLAERGRDRLWRSLSKLARARGVPLAEDERRWLERGYQR